MGAWDSELLEETRPATPPPISWPLLETLPARLAAEREPAAWRELLRSAHEELKARFLASEPVEELVHSRAALVDTVLREAWSRHCAALPGWALVAVGGYGRAELHPCSDIDILLLAPRAPDPRGGGAIEALIAFLWDIGLEVGHSVRTVAECAEECVGDVGVMTTLLEARLVAGVAQLLAAMRQALAPERLWPVKQFFEAKVREQAARHLKANDTAYNLEPNVKTGPGGLRDIQTIAWVAKRHFDADSLDGLVTHGFLTLAELRRLQQAQAFLWKVRFGLHTLTARREDRLLFDEEFRQNPRHHRLFLEILRSPVGVTHELRRMNTYGVLGRYIPAFGRIVGRMQYDLFHAYTVDAHTLFVVSNLRRFAIPRYDHELPEASRVMQQLPRSEVAYLAALFHDIAKGRGGDHSELGAVDAEAFCLEQGLSPYDARLVAWLVRNHLQLSITSQKQDIGDPQVINAFARKVGDETHLDYLYVLTCADVRATNPKLWNSWKASLFRDF